MGHAGEALLGGGRSTERLPDERASQGACREAAALRGAAAPNRKGGSPASGRSRDHAPPTCWAFDATEPFAGSATRKGMAASRQTTATSLVHFSGIAARDFARWSRGSGSPSSGTATRRPTAGTAQSTYDPKADHRFAGTRDSVSDMPRVETQRRRRSPVRRKAAPRIPRRDRRFVVQGVPGMSLDACRRYCRRA